MQPPPKRSGFYSQVQEDEESDYEDSPASNKQKTAKHKKAITVNPTEGFRYSDIYQASSPSGLVPISSFSPSSLHFFVLLGILPPSLVFSTFQDAPPEEAYVVERILSHRVRPSKDTQEHLKYGELVEEFLVKYKN